MFYVKLYIVYHLIHMYIYIYIRYDVWLVMVYPYYVVPNYMEEQTHIYIYMIPHIIDVYMLYVIYIYILHSAPTLQIQPSCPSVSAGPTSLRFLWLISSTTLQIDESMMSKHFSMSTSLSWRRIIYLAIHFGKARCKGLTPSKSLIHLQQNGVYTQTKYCFGPFCCLAFFQHAIDSWCYAVFILK